MGSIPVLSLFSGAGGLDLGFEEAGFRPLLALDSSSAAVESYNTNRTRLGRPARVADLAHEDPDAIMKRWRQLAGDRTQPVGIIGGPPCQAFSVANTRKSADDPRAALSLHYVRIFKALHARCNLDFFVFENVTGLARKLHSDAMSMLVKCFEETGFEVRPLFLDAVDFGVPQFRRRLFLVGFNRRHVRTSCFQLPTRTDGRVTVRDAIGGLPDPMFYTRQSRPADIGLHPNHWCMNPRSAKFRNGTIKSGEMKARSFRRLAWDTPSWTVSYGHREVHVHPNGKRRLSVYEAMLLQGFPSWYRLSGNLSEQIQLVSDAVPPPLARSVGLAVKDFLTGNGLPRPEEAQPSRNGHFLQLGLKGLQMIAPKSTSA